MDRLSRRGLPRGSVARVLRARAARGKNRKYASYRRGAREEDARRPSPAPPGGVWGHLSRRVVDGVGWDERARLPRQRGRDSPRVAKTTSAQATVCFELNATVVAVAVLVLRHTSWPQCLGGQSGLCVAARGTDSQSTAISFYLHCCDCCQTRRQSLLATRTPADQIEFVSQSAAIEQARVGIERCNQRIAEALGNPG